MIQINIEPSTYLRLEVIALTRKITLTEVIDDLLNIKNKERALDKRVHCSVCTPIDPCNSCLRLIYNISPKDII